MISTHSRTHTQIVASDLAKLQLAPPHWHWREETHQHMYAERVAQSDKKIVMLELEPGVGKSLVPLAAAHALNQTTTVLVQTIQLERQYLRDFQRMRMMSGRRNFTCNLTNGPVDRAPCTIGAYCSHMGRVRNGIVEELPECTYYLRKLETAQTKLRVLNYDYFLQESKGVRSQFGSADWFILDEAHKIDVLLMQAGNITLDRQNLTDLDIEVLHGKRELGDWQTWAAGLLKVCTNRIDHLTNQARQQGVYIPQQDNDDEPFQSRRLADVAQLPEVQEIVSQLKRVATVQEAVGQLVSIKSTEHEEWVQDHDRSHLNFKPIYGKYAFRRILAGARSKVVLMSAFLAPDMLMRTLDLDPDNVDVIQAGEIYDRSKSQIYYCPTIKFKHSTTSNQWKFGVAVLDEFIDHFAPKKGFVHVPSVKLRDTILRNSKHRDLFIVYGPRNNRDGLPTKDQAIETFTKRKGQCVLLGQSISTGIDIPYVPEFNIIVKLPFPSITDAATKKRKEVDKDFYPYLVLCDLVQAAGRIKRAADHDGPTIILDKNMGWFYVSNQDQFPEWFANNYNQNGWSIYNGISDRLRDIGRKHRIILHQGR